MLRWYVVNTKPKKEFHLEKILVEAGIVCYLPKTREERTVKPFFPSYEFIYFEYPEQFKLIKYTRGVKSIVGNDRGPIPLEETFIDEIRSREVGGFIELQKYGVEPDLGDEIEVAVGPFKGLRGIFQKGLSERDRVLIFLNCVSYQGQLVIEKSKIKKVLS
jgi:transcription antitermination factor NusG